MNEKKIEVGDNVIVSFGDGGRIAGEVLYTPCATGDCWTIKSKNGLFCVQTYQSIWRPSDER